MRLRPALVLAAPAGVLGGHAIGYLAAPGPAGAAAVHHGYLALAGAIAVPLALFAVGWAATAGATARPARPARPVPVGPLLLAQWVLFTGQEAVEHAAAGHGAAAVLHSPALWWGLAAQVVTAAAVVVLLRASAVTGARLVAVLGGVRPIVLRALSWRPAPPAGSPKVSPVVAGPPRGPPPVAFA